MTKTRIRAEYETGIIDQVVPTNGPVKDRFSAWTTRGSPIIATPITNPAALGVSRLSNRVQVSYIDNNNSLMNQALAYTTDGTDNYAGYYDPLLADYSVNSGGQPGQLRYSKATWNTVHDVGKHGWRLLPRGGSLVGVRIRRGRLMRLVESPLRHRLRRIRCRWQSHRQWNTARD